MKKQIEQMLKIIELEANITAAYTGRKKFSDAVMSAMSTVDRVNFVPKQLKPYSYDNGPLTIGYGQTISQPYIVALMTDLLELTPDSVVLEIGTGSGYQTAILSCLAKKIYTIENVGELYQSARKLLQQLGYNNVETNWSNGYYGWQEKAPFDAIMVTAAASHVPPALIEQLKPGGRMVIPVGLPYLPQELMLVTKQMNGTTSIDSILSVAFVPLVTEDINYNKTLH